MSNGQMMTLEQFRSALAEFGQVDLGNLTGSSEIDTTIPEHWSTEVEDYSKDLRFMRFFTTEKRELQSRPGDTIRVQKRVELTNAGNLTETARLQGNEEQLSFTQIVYNPAERGNAILLSKEANSKSVLNLRQEARINLGDWAAQKMDTDAVDAMEDLPGAQIRFGGSATNQAGLGASDKITLALLLKTKYEMEGAKVPKFNRIDRRLRKFVGDGSTPLDGFYVCLLHPFSAFDLTQDSDYKTAVQQGSNTIFAQGVIQEVGPFFKGQVVGFVDGVLILKTTNISYTNEGGTYTVKVARNLMFGPRALGRAVGLSGDQRGNAQSMIWGEQQFDYGRQMGIALRWWDQHKLLNNDRVYGMWVAASDLAA